MLDDLTEDTTITTTNDKNLLGVGVGVERKMGDHLLVRELITLGALDDVVEDEDVAVIGGLKDEDLDFTRQHTRTRSAVVEPQTYILVERLLVVENLLDLEGHSLAGPHVGDLAEPSV